MSTNNASEDGGMSATYLSADEGASVRTRHFTTLAGGSTGGFSRFVSQVTMTHDWPEQYRLA